MIKSVSYNVSALRETNFTVYALINLSGSGSRNEPGWLQIDCNPFPFILFCSTYSLFLSFYVCIARGLFPSFLPSFSSSAVLTRLDLTLQWPMMYREGSHWLNYKGGATFKGWREEWKERTGRQQRITEKTLVMVYMHLTVPRQCNIGSTPFVLCMDVNEAQFGALEFLYCRAHTNNNAE